MSARLADNMPTGHVGRETVGAKFPAEVMLVQAALDMEDGRGQPRFRDEPQQEILQLNMMQNDNCISYLKFDVIQGQLFEAWRPRFYVLFCHGVKKKYDEAIRPDNIGEGKSWLTQQCWTTYGRRRYEWAALVYREDWIAEGSTKAVLYADAELLTSAPRSKTDENKIRQ